MQKKIQDIRSSIASGKETFTEAASRTRIFTGAYTRMLSAGARAGALDEVMRQISIQYDEEVEEQLDSLLRPSGTDAGCCSFRSRGSDPALCYAAPPGHHDQYRRIRYESFSEKDRPAGRPAASYPCNLLLSDAPAPSFGTFVYLGNRGAGRGQTLEDAVLQDAVQCYALEGFIRRICSIWRSITA